jgi:hypothetical protein
VQYGLQGLRSHIEEHRHVQRTTRYLQTRERTDRQACLHLPAVQSPARVLALLRRDATPVLIGVALAEIAGIPSQALRSDQRFAHQGFAGSPDDGNTRRSGDWCLPGALMLVRSARSEIVVSPTKALRHLAQLVALDLETLGEGVLGKSSTAKTRNGTL